MREKRYLEIGKITTTHGIRGELRVLPWCDDCHSLCSLSWISFDPMGKKKLRVEQIRVHKKHLIVKFCEIESIEAAKEYCGLVLYAKREELPLPEGRYFIHDLLGAKVLDADTPSVCYGTLQDILQTGANDVYQIVDENGKERLAPAISDVVDRIDLETCEIYIRPLKGLFEDED